MLTPFLLTGHSKALKIKLEQDPNHPLFSVQLLVQQTDLLGMQEVLISQTQLPLFSLN